jgi:hypothetical protein
MKHSQHFHPKYSLQEIQTCTLTDLYRRLEVAHVPEDWMEAYRGFVRRAQEMARDGFLNGSVEIRNDGIYRTRGSGRKNKRLKVA